MVNNVIKAMAGTESLHRKYLIARDWAEFDAAGRIPAGFDQPDKYAELLYMRFGQMSQEQAEENVRTMRRLFGDDVVLHAAKDVLAAPKTHRGNLVNHAPDVPVVRDQYGARLPDLSVPQPNEVIGIYSGQLEAFELIGARTDDRRYALALLADKQPHAPSESRHIGKWAFAEKAYKNFVDAYGSATVLQAAHAVRTATKQLYDGEVMHPEAIGALRHERYKAFQDVLAKNDPGGAVKLILAFDPGANSREELNAAYGKLVAKYTEPKIFAAMTKIAQTNPDPIYGEYKLLTNELDGTTACDPDSGAPTRGKAGAIARGGCPTTAGSSVGSEPVRPYEPSQNFPRYELSQSSAWLGIARYCHDIYNPPQPLLSQEQIKKYYANTGRVEAEEKRCESWFDPKQVMVNRLQAMHYCLEKYDFMNRTGNFSKQQYDACMNQHDTLTALCTVEFRNRQELDRKKGTQSVWVDLCPAEAPAEGMEHTVAKAGSEGLEHVTLPPSGPELPAVLKSPLAAGLLYEPRPMQAIVIPRSPTEAAPAAAPPPEASVAAPAGVRQGSPAAPPPDGPVAGAANAGRGGALNPPGRLPSLPFGVPNKRPPNLPGNGGAGSAQVALMNRLSADSRRASQARAALQRTQVGNATLPDDVAAARGRLDVELRQASMTTVQNPGAAEPSLTQLEGTLSVLETFLNSRPKP